MRAPPLAVALVAALVVLTATPATAIPSVEGLAHRVVVMICAGDCGGGGSGGGGPGPDPACDDGWDNDGDGYTDYPSDPGCSWSGDGDEWNAPPCDWTEAWMSGAEYTTASGWGTEVDVDADYRYGCPGGPVSDGASGACWTPSGWTLESCGFVAPLSPPGRRVVASWSCSNPFICGGSWNDHSLDIEVRYSNLGPSACVGSGPISGSPDSDCSWGNY